MNARTLDEIRRAFDRSFAEPAATRPEPPERLLRIRVAGHAHVVRLNGLDAIGRIGAAAPLPSAKPALIGVTSWAGALIPLYDLARLIGTAEPSRSPGWMIVAGGNAPVGLAFDAFEGRIEVPGGSVVEGSVRTDGKALPLIDVASLVLGICGRR
jgi:purine-binding chemotaxis protein CheW